MQRRWRCEVEHRAGLDGALDVGKIFPTQVPAIGNDGGFIPDWLFIPLEGCNLLVVLLALLCICPVVPPEFPGAGVVYANDCLVGDPIRRQDCIVGTEKPSPLTAS